ncbi:MAG: hypothetical protein E7465_00250 [Ruminococcaceae bacterium]|nr:hypothetical protein [Oscillospiraceae bacterium]
MREYTKWEKFQNWFHYHKLGVIAVAVILWVAGTMLWNVLGIGEVEPDYRFAYVGSRKLTDGTVEALEKALATLAEDHNGDGLVTVQVTHCVTADSRNMENMMYGYAAEVTVLADITEGESTFFLLENPVDFQLSFQVLANLDGSIPAEDDFEALDKVYRWADCPVLAALDLGTYEDNYLDITETGEVQDLLANLYLGRRYYYDPAQQENPEADNALWLAMTEGATQ